MALSRKKRPSRANLLQRFAKQKQRNILAQPGPRQAVIVLDGLKPNYNIGKIFRSAEAFGIRKIHLIDIGVFDPAPAKGSFRYVPAVFDEGFAACHAALSKERYTLFVFDPHRGRVLHEQPLPERSAFVFGHEEFGFSFAPEKYDHTPIRIPQVGRIESLNVSVAASIAMYEYMRQHPTTGNIR